MALLHPMRAAFADRSEQDILEDTRSSLAEGTHGRLSARAVAPGDDCAMLGGVAPRGPPSKGAVRRCPRGTADDRGGSALRPSRRHFPRAVPPARRETR
jgi:hypothetical protein